MVWWEKNGAGKSTLAKLITGAHWQDSGVIEIFGHPLIKGKPAAALKAGVVAVYQEPEYYSKALPS